MSVKVLIPVPLRSLSGGQEQVEVTGDESIARSLYAKYIGM
jgi:hypothetical protein